MSRPGMDRRGLLVQIPLVVIVMPVLYRSLARGKWGGVRS